MSAIKPITTDVENRIDQQEFMKEVDKDYAIENAIRVSFDTQLETVL